MADTRAVERAALDWARGLVGIMKVEVKRLEDLHGDMQAEIMMVKQQQNAVIANHTARIVGLEGSTNEMRHHLQTLMEFMDELYQSLRRGFTVDPEFLKLESTDITLRTTALEEGFLKLTGRVTTLQEEFKEIKRVLNQLLPVPEESANFGVPAPLPKQEPDTEVQFPEASVTTQEQKRVPVQEKAEAKELVVGVSSHLDEADIDVAEKELVAKDSTHLDEGNTDVAGVSVVVASEFQEQEQDADDGVSQANAGVNKEFPPLRRENYEDGKRPPTR